MRILHYSLGFPPKRTGGLVTYTIDLMNEQIKNGDSVFFLYPANINFFKKNTHIQFDSKRSSNRFYPYALINSLPLSLIGGIKNPKDFMKPVDKKIYYNFLKEIKPDVIHVHTLMGLHKEFFECAKTLGIKTVFTSHDYFGLAPEPSFFFQGENYDQHNTLDQWIKISKESMPTWKLRLFQTSIYPTIRWIMNRARPEKVSMIVKKEKRPTSKTTKKEIRKAFDCLKAYYCSIFHLIDFFHFNSQLAFNVFRNNIPLDNNYSCVSITNASVKEHLVTGRKAAHKKTKIAYIGPYKNYKGFFEFLKLPKILGTEKYEYHTYGSNAKFEFPKSIVNHGRYTRKDEVYENIDIIIVPSLWKETFGFVTVEALSYNKIVLVSKNVGSKELIDNNFIFRTVKDIPKQLKYVKSYRIKQQKKMSDHYLEIKKIYNGS
ncbi:glycosyltransferase [Pediococcus ethanolidurans]|uniref:glycosyltransferase n=1 Tax=Pediococcus ethanolidurans TaxID=319653 RepID=UPI0029539076|nr:glycosyltransferase [Pediococcus ethanolidurans]MDV7720228.1 glycosyltransferase [Pediococcus ethanolidurans]